METNFIIDNKFLIPFYKIFKNRFKYTNMKLYKLKKFEKIIKQTSK